MSHSTSRMSLSLSLAQACPDPHASGRFRPHNAMTDLHGGDMDQYRAWVGADPAGPARETWDEAAQDAVSAGLAAWVTDCVSTAINWSTTPAFISRTRRTGSANN